MNRKKTEPFDAYLKLGYRQVTVIATSTKQLTPYDASLLSACPRYECLAVFSLKEQEQKLKYLISKHTNRNAIL
jgi:hypothetical protein